MFCSWPDMGRMTNDKTPKDPRKFETRNQIYLGVDLRANIGESKTAFFAMPRGFDGGQVLPRAAGVDVEQFEGAVPVVLNKFPIALPHGAGRFAAQVAVARAMPVEASVDHGALAGLDGGARSMPSTKWPGG